MVLLYQPVPAPLFRHYLATSDNGITGVWSPSVIDNQNSGTYTFIPDAGLCAVATNLTVTINPIVTPTFAFGTALTICSSSAGPDLPLTSTNGITGTWDPAVVDNQANGVYTFTPAAGECATTTTFTVTVTPTVIPVFSFGGTLIICTGGTVPPLPPTSTNGIDGVWNPAVVSNQANGVYTFTPTATPDQCIAVATFTVTVRPILTPAFDFGTAQTICAGGIVPQLPLLLPIALVEYLESGHCQQPGIGRLYLYFCSRAMCYGYCNVYGNGHSGCNAYNRDFRYIVFDGATIPAEQSFGNANGCYIQLDEFKSCHWTGCCRHR